MAGFFVLKIALIIPESSRIDVLGRFSDTMTPLPNLGLPYIAAILEENGHKILAIDQFAQKINHSQVLSLLRDFKPDLVGFSCLTAAMPSVEAMSALIRTDLPKTKIVLGNVHASVFHDYLIQKGVGDFIVHGEGESIIAQLCEALECGESPEKIAGLSMLRNGEAVYTGPAPQIEDLDKLPFPAWHLFPYHLYECHPLFGVNGVCLPVIASRGCPYSCFFCAQASAFNGVRVRSAQNVVDEMEYLVDRFNAPMSGLADCMYPLTHKMGMDFCRQLIDRKLHKKLCWATEMRVDMAEPELLGIMKEANAIQIAYGVESGNEAMLQRLGKKFKMEDARRAIALTKQAGLSTCGFFVLGFPGETSSSCWDTIRFAKELDLDFAKFNIAVPYPGTPFFDSWWDGKVEDMEYHKYNAWFSPQKGDSLLHVPEDMTQKELLRFQHLAMAAFWIRPSKIFQHFKNGTISPKVMWKGFKAMILSMFDSFFRS